MIDYVASTYDFEDSLYAPIFSFEPRIGDAEEEEQKAMKATEELLELSGVSDEELLAELGSRPTSYPKTIGAGDFAGMLSDIRSADSMEEKAEILSVWADFFHDSLGEALAELAKSILDEDVEAARRLIRRICA